MREKINNIFIKIAGLAFIFFGIISLFLPFLQGLLFILIGLYILSLRYPKLKALFEKTFARYPRFKESFDKSHSKIRSFFGISI